VLDIGSGSGGLFFWKEYLLPVRPDLRMTALDLRKGEHFDRFDNYVLFNLDGGDIPLPENSFDYIFLSHVIEHVKDWRSLLEKCNKVLKEKGIMYIETPSKHTVYLPSRDFYRQKGFPCTTINFMDDHTHVETVDLDEVNDYASGFNAVALEKGYCRNPFLEDILLSFGHHHNDLATSQYGLWSKLIFSSYIILQRI
jgi:SAM-dependent methyltransferase